MAVLSMKPMSVGQQSVNPRWILISTDDDAATVLTAGYLTAPNQIFATDLQDSDMALVTTVDAGVTSSSVFEVSLGANGAVSLNAPINPGNVTLPVVDGHIAVFDGTTGLIKMTADPAINLGAIYSGASGSDGAVRIYPPTASNGYFELISANSSGNFPSILRNHPNVAQTTTYTLGDAAAADQEVLVTTATNVGNSAALKSRDTTAAFDDLDAGGAVGIISGAGYKIRAIFLNSAGTNFSGGGGDRNIQISDGTTVYTVIPAATAQSLANETWGSTAVPFPAAASINTTTAGTLFIAYSGGTTDYTAGSLTISVLLEKVT